MAQEFYTDALGNNAEISESLVVEITANKTISLDESGKIFLVGTDALTITLPATKKGAKYTFINSGADGNNLITISPNANDAIFGTIANAAADSVASGVADKDIVNTKATSNKGDRITLVGDGVDGWYIVEGVGIWASQA
jgi:hypothetical protein